MAFAHMVMLPRGGSADGAEQHVPIIKERIPHLPQLVAAFIGFEPSAMRQAKGARHHRHIAFVISSKSLGLERSSFDVVFAHALGGGGAQQGDEVFIGLVISEGRMRFEGDFLRACA